MASTVVKPIAQNIASLITGLAVTPSMVGVVWGPRELPQIPCGVVRPPTIGRTEPKGEESQLGSDDWDLSYPVTLYFEFDEASKSQDQAVEIVEAFIKAVDANPDLDTNGIADEASVVSAEPVIVDDQTRALFAYDCRIVLTTLV